MIEIARHLEILLLDNDCVIVPGLGGFMAHSIRSSYSEEEQLFLPPCRMLGFNPLLRINDSLLAQSYVEVYDLSYPEALRRIESEVNELQQHLANEGSYTLDNIGRLSINPEGHMEFEPYEAGIFTPSLYGLCPFEMPRLSVAEPVENTPAPTAATVSKSLEALSATAYEDANDRESEREEEKAIVIKMSWIRNAVAVAAAIIAFLLMSPTITNYQQDGMEISAIPVPIMPKSEMTSQPLKQDLQRQETAEATQSGSQQAAEVAAQEAAEVAAQEAATKVVAQEKTELREAAEETKASQPENYYCIVLASHVSQRNAELFVQRLHHDGFSEARIIEHHHIRRVVYGSFTTEQEAYNELRADRKSNFFEEAWVYHVK